MENNPHLSEEQNTQLAPIIKLAQLNHVQVANNIISAVRSGAIDPLRIHMFLKRVEILSKTVLKDDDVKRITLSNAENHITQGSSFDYMGAKLTVQAVSTVYDYSACGDPLWDNLDELEKTIKSLKAEREVFLKNAFPEKQNSLFGSPSPKVIVDQLFTLTPTDCGEEITLRKPIKIQKQGIKTSFPK